MAEREGVRSFEQKQTESSANMAVTTSTRSVISHLDTLIALRMTLRQFNLLLQRRVPKPSEGGSPASDHTGNDIGGIRPQL